MRAAELLAWHGLGRLRPKVDKLKKAGVAVIGGGDL